jgi:hypothetical protein
MCFMSGSIEMENVYVPENEVGMWQWLFGKSLSSIILRNSGTSDGFVGIAAPSLARILPVSACQTYHISVNNSFLAPFKWAWLMIHTCYWI